ncbi:DUF4130 domain-containing protein [Paenibacillus phocaensis]|uniref:DUF4130 domain-containing protein n=1 Tax=Paenibacillus phocaensis TaxID=1776378 RepID=UPI000DA6021A|nr:DUF4130 domain-containing protein [Paenibacillus phocaensis]
MPPATEYQYFADQRRQAGVVCQKGEAAKRDVYEKLALPEAGGQELTYRRLWKRFYDTMAIRERLNPRAQMSHMPKRYWARLTEMRKV